MRSLTTLIACLLFGATARGEGPLPIAKLIDAEIQKRLEAKKVRPSPLADDAEFLRRVTLDLTGRIPTAERAAAFLSSTKPDRRSALIDELLASPLYGDHCASRWTD